MAISRRKALEAAGAVAATSALGCGSDTSSGGDGDDTDGGGSGDDSGTDGGSADDTGSADDGSDTGTGTDTGGIPPSDPSLLQHIEHIVVLTMENRSFDHMLGALRLEGRLDVDGLTGKESNPDLQGNEHPIHPLTGKIVNDPLHTNDKAVYAWNGGANDFFVHVHQAAGLQPKEEVMGYHEREDLPVLYALADEYTVCDRWFAAMLGPTWPNRLYLHCASSNGNLANETAMGLPSLYGRLDEAGIANRYYFGNLAMTAMYGHDTNAFDVEQFFVDAEAGTLPAFCFVDPAVTTSAGEGYDDHPPLDFTTGQAFVASVYDALAKSPLWPKTLLILIYDEYGGLFDHVPPPEVVDERPEFRRLGFRIPALLIGPTVRKGFCFKETLEHVSVHATVNRRFGLEPLNERAATANDVSGAIDPAFVDDPRDPITLPAIAVAREAPPVALPPGVGQEELRALIDEGNCSPRFDVRHRERELREAWLRRAEKAGLVVRTPAPSPDRPRNA